MPFRGITTQPPRPGFDDALAASTMRSLGPPTFAFEGEEETLVGIGDSNPLTRGADRYSDRGVLGRGGMSLVRSMHDQVIARTVAVKTYGVDSPPSAHEHLRFIEEARVTGQLEHPNIVPVYDLDEGGAGHGPEIVMKQVQGETLARVIQRGGTESLSQASLEPLLEIFLRVCDAVAYAHSRGVVHRDLKPENVMVGPLGQVYVMDWGVSRILNAEGRNIEPLVGVAPSAEEEGAIVGTVIYMSPEQARGQCSAVDERTDVFGLGAILYAILAARPLYHAATMLDAFQLARDGRYEAPEVAAPHRAPPPALCRIFTKACAFRRSERYPSVQALRDALTRVLRDGIWFATRSYAAEETIVLEGDSGDEAFIVVDGRCGVFKHTPRGRALALELGPGDVFGEAVMFGAAARTATVVALTPLTVQVVTRAALDRELEGRTWVRQLLVTLAGRFSSTDAELRRLLTASEAEAHGRS